MKIDNMNKYFFLYKMLIVVILILPVENFSLYKDGQNQFNPKGNIVSCPIETYIVWNSNSVGKDSIDRISFQNTFKSIGLPPILIPLQKLRSMVISNNNLIIIPHASALLLNKKDVYQIKRAIKDGARIITDGKSSLAIGMGIKFSPPSTVKFVRDLIYPSMLLQWADTPKVSLILNAPNKTNRLLYADSATGNSLGILKNSGKGMFLFLSTLFDGLSGEGYSRFPNLLNIVIEKMHCIPMFQRNGVDVYFDPGYNYNTPVEKLVASWKSWGIKVVHVSAWYYYDLPPYNYKLLIREAHKQGILVYAWLEWPYIGIGFWNAHPEWRMKNALLLDAQIDFLSLMDLQNPACMKSAINDLSTLLKEDFDGIDIAEFSITGDVSNALEGPKDPKYFTGFNSTARNEFKSINGFDQIDLFNESSEHYWKKDSPGLDKFYNYRRNVNNSLLSKIVNSIDSIKVADSRDWELEFTVLDNSLHPEFDRLLGFDLPNTIKLARKFHSTLQVEDPASEWTRPPIRYDQLAKTYADLAPGMDLAIDINIVPVHTEQQINFASEQQTGMELFRMFNFADINCGRVCLYSVSSVFKHDFDILPYAMASGASIHENNNHWSIHTSHTVIMNNLNKHGIIFLDKEIWPCYNAQGIIIPIGDHILSYGDTVSASVNKNNKLRLTGISDELLSCSQSKRGIALRYKSFARCLISTNKLPALFKLDGNIVSLKVLKGKGEFQIFAPPGIHYLELEL